MMAGFLRGDKEQEHKQRDEMELAMMEEDRAEQKTRKSPAGV